MTVNQSVSGQPSVLVSQPGGSFVTLVPNTSQSEASATSTQRSLLCLLLKYSGTVFQFRLGLVDNYSTTRVKVVEITLKVCRAKCLYT